LHSGCSRVGGTLELVTVFLGGGLLGVGFDGRSDLVCAKKINNVVQTVVYTVVPVIDCLPVSDMLSKVVWFGKVFFCVWWFGVVNEKNYAEIGLLLYSLSVPHLAPP
jgi:hypothetical protein